MVGYLLWPLLAASSIAVVSVLGWRKSWPLDLIVCATSLIVANALLLSLFGAFSAMGWAITLMVQLALALMLVWRTRGFAALRAPREKIAALGAWRQRAQALRPKTAWAGVELALTTLAILAMVWALAVFSGEALFQMQWAPVNKDSFSYHIPRAYFWLQEGRVGPLPVTDFRWNEFPPNSSILIAWSIAAGGFPQWVAIAQHVGVLLLCLSTWLIVRRLGGSVAVAAIAVLCLFSFPSLYLQARTASNDVLVAGLILATAYYLVALFDDLTRESRAHWGNAALFGACVGLGCGVKLTFGLIAPAAVLAAVLVVWSQRKAIAQAPRRFALQALAIATAIVTLGAWGYVQNLAAFGHPFVSPETAALRAAQYGEPTPLPIALLLSAYQTATLHGLETAFPALLDTRYSIFSALAGLIGIEFASLPPIADHEGLRNPLYDFGATGHGLVGALAGFAAVIGAFGFTIAAILRRNWRDAVLAFFAFGCVTSIILFSMAKDWSPSYPRYFLTFLPLGLVVLMCAIDRTRALKYVLLAPLALYSIWITLWMTDASPWRREIGHQAEQGFRAIDLAYNGDLAPAFRALARTLPPDTRIEIFSKQDAWVYTALLEAPGPRYMLSSSAEAPMAASYRLVEVHGFFHDRGFPLPRMVGPPRIWLIGGDLSSFVRANTDLYEMAQEPDGDWVMSARALATLSGATYATAREMNQIRFSVPTFLIGTAPQRFSFKVRSRSNIQQIVRRVVCNGVEAPWALGDTTPSGTSMAITISAPAEGGPTHCALVLTGRVLVSANPQRGADLTIVAPGRLELVR